MLPYNKGMTRIAQKNIQAGEPLVMGVLRASACGDYGMNTLQALILAQLLFACTRGNFLHVSLEGRKFYWVDTKRVAASNLISSRYLREYIIDPLAKGPKLQGVDVPLIPVIAWRRIGYNKWGMAFNKKPICYLVSEQFKGDMEVLFDVNEFEDLRPKLKGAVEVKGRGPKLGGHPDVVKQVYGYMMGKTLPDGTKIFRHPDPGAKVVTQAIGRMGDLRDGTFFDKIRIHDDFWEYGTGRRMEGVREEIIQLAHGSPNDFVSAVKRAVDNYATAFLDGREPSRKESLTRSLNDFFFNVVTKRSWFIYFFRHPADDLREKIADKIWLDLPAGIRKVGDAIYRENMDARAFWENMKKLSARAFEAQRRYANETAYWYDKPSDLIRKFYGFIVEVLDYDPDTLTAKHFAPTGRTFYTYTNHVRREYPDVTREIVGVFTQPR